MQLSISQASHPGRKRDSNEDACLVDEPAGLVVLCDGVGGEYAGEVASQMACATVVSALHAGRSLLQAVQNAHDAVLAAATGRREGMATTLVAAHIVGNQAELVWAGDSGAYLLDRKKGQCRLLTPPHSLVAQLVTLGTLTPEEAIASPLRHTITQALGSDARPFEPSAAQVVLRKGDRLLLCSDGVSDVLDEVALWELAGPHVDRSRAADTVVTAAVERSGHDNTTAIVVAVSDRPTIRRRVQALMR